MVLGLGSMFNHGVRRQNVGWTRDLQRQVIVYTALRDIEPGQELLISYGPQLTFVDVDGDQPAEEGGGGDPLKGIVLGLDCE